MTGINGRAGICWTLGSAGANQVRATPSLGGDAVEGVSFAPASTTFDAIANPPAGLVFSLQPPTEVRAGLVFPTQVTVVDKNGERVWNSTEKVSLHLDHGSFADGTTTFGTQAVAGLATFSVNPIGAVGTYRLSASAKFLLPPAVLPQSSSFEVTPGIAWTLGIQAGNGLVTGADPALCRRHERAAPAHARAGGGADLDTRRRDVGGDKEAVGRAADEGDHHWLPRRGA